MKLFWTDLHQKRKEQSDEAKARKKKEKHDEMVQACEDATNEKFKKLDERLGNIDGRLDIAQECDRAGLRNGLMGLYYDCDFKGFRTEDDSKNYREMHDAYNKAGGNSFIDSDVSEWFNNIPLKPNDYKPKKSQTARKRVNNDKKGGAN